ncbi:Phenylacetaldoxime dehydratase [Lachnellula suecica]|uniref:Phenylacetaldoxime dehydratase n=1 Tax=Lachnellula suecica TaxID=602035 RepID=A0A8T9BYH4_9HELO|nr:Phenylacetaldoxime dehydratase [Lachnellula suecica]
MVFLANLDAPELLFTYALFGVQYHTLTPSKAATIASLHKLLASSADRVDILREESHGHGLDQNQNDLKTTIFVAYWLRSQDYQKLKDSEPFTKFWSSLPDDAGVWREVMTVPKSRYMYAASQPLKAGLACMLDLRQSNDEGYWGVYRHRLAGNPDLYTDPSDTFTSPYTTSAKSKNTAEKAVIIDIPKSFPKEIVKGKVRLSSPPDNICFVREIQRKSDLDTEELDAWLQQISPHAQSWITHLDQERNKTGVLSMSTHLAHTAKQSTSTEELVTEAMPEANQLVYFLDLAHFEVAGKSHKGHVELRKTVMGLYGPGGKLSGGKAALFVELCVLKSGDLEAEYVGCVAGTGLMYLRDL